MHTHAHAHLSCLLSVSFKKQMYTLNQSMSWPAKKALSAAGLAQTNASLGSKFVLEAGCNGCCLPRLAPNTVHHILHRPEHKHTQAHGQTNTHTRTERERERERETHTHTHAHTHKQTDRQTHTHTHRHTQTHTQTSQQRKSEKRRGLSQRDWRKREQAVLTVA